MGRGLLDSALLRCIKSGSEGERYEAREQLLCGGSAAEEALGAQANVATWAGAMRTKRVHTGRSGCSSSRPARLPKPSCARRSPPLD